MFKALLIFITVLPSAWAEDSSVDGLEIPGPVEVKSAKDLEPTPKTSAPVLSAGGRIDLAFSGGAPVAQGFFIPSLRLGIHGSMSSRLDYALAVGQTREFSSAQLPQVLPVDAYFSLRVLGSEDDSPLRVKLGMFNPTLNPWWTPDLAELALPDFQTNHRSVLLDNDLGMELQFQPGMDRLKFTLGIFNGNGIYALNTNNAKAFTASVDSYHPFDGDTKVHVGVSAFTQTQSAVGSVNYRSNWAFDVYASLEMGPWLAGGDLLAGGFEDSSRVVYPFGTGVFVLSRLAEDLHLYVRHEYLRSSPNNSGDQTTWQLGPMITVDRAFKAFFYYESVNTSTGIINSGQVRLRLVM